MAFVDFHPFATPFSRAEAVADLAFLLPIANVPALIDNSTFTATLGCSNGDQNVTCTEVCSNVTSVFSSWSNFYTCSWYPALSQALEDTNTTRTGDDSLTSFGIYQNQTELSGNTSITIATCLSDYCTSSSLCLGLDIANACSLGGLLESTASSMSLNRVNAFNCVQKSVCGSIVDVNPDIGGLGVVLSLLIQYSIPVWAMNLHYFLYLWNRRTQKRIRTNSKVESMNAQLLKAEESYNGHLAALTSALVEFQKAQCFFAVTLQIAALIVIPEYLKGMHSKDQILLRLTAANGFSPIMLTLAHIDFLGGRNSWYLLFLSGVAFTLGTATYWYTSPQLTGGPINWQTTYDNPAAPLPSCGNVAPFAPCFVKNQFQDYNIWPKFQGVSLYKLTETVGLVVWVVCLIIFLYRVAYKICHIRNNWPRLSKHLSNFRADFKRSLDTSVARLQSHKQGARFISLIRWYSTIFHLPQISGSIAHAAGKSRTWDYTHLTLGYLGLVAQTASVIIVLSTSSHLIATQMSFGQIVAVGIWVPVLLEYAYLEINGAEEGTEYRLKAPLIVSQPSSSNTGASSNAPGNGQGTVLPQNLTQPPP